MKSTFLKLALMTVALVIAAWHLSQRQEKLNEKSSFLKESRMQALRFARKPHAPFLISTEKNLVGTNQWVLTAHVVSNTDVSDALVQWNLDPGIELVAGAATVSLPILSAGEKVSASITVFALNGSDAKAHAHVYYREQDESRGSVAQIEFIDEGDRRMQVANTMPPLKPDLLRKLVQ